MYLLVKLLLVGLLLNLPLWFWCSRCLVEVLVYKLYIFFIFGFSSNSNSMFIYYNNPAQTENTQR